MSKAFIVSLFLFFKIVFLLKTASILLVFRWMDGSQVVFEMWDDKQLKFSNYDETCGVMFDGKYRLHYEVKLYQLIGSENKYIIILINLFTLILINF